MQNLNLTSICDFKQSQDVLKIGIFTSHDNKEKNDLIEKLELELKIDEEKYGQRFDKFFSTYSPNEKIFLIYSSGGTLIEKYKKWFNIN